MKRKWSSLDYTYIIWCLVLLGFLIIMAERYCRMVYGIGIFHVLAGQNELTAEEKEYLDEWDEVVYGESLDSFPNMNYDSRNQEGGFAIDMMNQISLEIEKQISFQPILWPDIFQSLEDGTVDMIQITYSREREDEYYLTDPLYRNRGVVLMKNEAGEVDTLEQLQGKTIAGIKEDYALEILREKVPDLHILECDSITECARALQRQDLDGIVADEQNIMYYVQAQGLMQDYYVVDEEVYYEGVVFAVRKSDRMLGEILNKAVHKLRQQDTLDKLQQKWFLSSILDDAVSERELSLWRIEMISGIALCFVYLFFHIHHGTRKMVAERTRELRQERKRLETVIDSIPQVLLEVTRDGKVVRVNQEGRQKQGLADYSREQVQDERLLSLLEKAKENHWAEQEISEGNRWYRVTCSSVPRESEEETLILLIEDITLRRLQERQEMQNYKMAAIGQLASGISHELKNPLEIICNYCYALKKGILHTREDILHTVDVIEEEASDANKIVESLLSFARETPREVSETELKSCLQSILELQMPLIRRRKIEVELLCEDNIVVRCNPEGMKRIIVNLLTNAEDAIGTDGGKIQITVTQQEQQVQIDFRDNGKGMSQETQEQIFNPFYTTKSKGTGLGLYLVYELVEDCEGTIEVHSTQGEGTLFTICLPGGRAGKLSGEETDRDSKR